MMTFARLSRLLGHVTWQGRSWERDPDSGKWRLSRNRWHTGLADETPSMGRLRTTAEPCGRRGQADGFCTGVSTSPMSSP
ncbi:hypothetical protein ACTAE5_35475 [Streptomyces antibioticus]